MVRAETESSIPIVAVVGPTASGKSSLAQRIALSIDGEVVSADSMQVYRGMDIGTGKVPIADRLVAHHCLDLVDPGEPFSAALFQEHARASFADIESRGKVPILCGGTGFYIRAAVDDYQFPKGEQVDNPLRDELNAFARENGPDALLKLLAERDPESAAIIPVNDVKRVVRAFELIEEGTTYAEQKKKLESIEQFLPCVFLGLSVEPNILRKRICDRVDEMIVQGLVQEVEGLLEKGFKRGVTAPQAIGYKEIVQALEGEKSLEEAVEEIKVATCRYAKRQRTWFRKDKRIHWIDANMLDYDAMCASSLDVIEQFSPLCR